MQRRKVIRSVRRNGYAKVVFFASNLSMWRYQGVYDLMSRDDRFKVFVVLCPFSTYTSRQKELNMSDLKDYFDGRDIRTIDGQANPDCLEEIDPDILFYPQPYPRLFNNRLDAIFNETKLICYTPYALFTVGREWAYNCRLQITAWKLFYQTGYHKAEAERFCYNGGRNVVVTGEPDADVFGKPVEASVWKQTQTRKKRIIWAPHYSISGNDIVHRASFLWMADFMLELAERYSDMIQIAFKPHPRLISELYDHPEWGQQYTDAYYEKWVGMPDTQLNTGGYIDLFCESDALIHDCGSFTAVYHYTNKPAMFVSRDIESIDAELNDLGRQCLDLHYFGSCPEDITSFIDNVVLGENDSKAEARSRFVNDVLMPPHDRSSARNIVDEIINSLGI